MTSRINIPNSRHESSETFTILYDWIMKLDCNLSARVLLAYLYRRRLMAKYEPVKVKYSDMREYLGVTRQYVAKLLNELSDMNQLEMDTLRGRSYVRIWLTKTLLPKQQEGNNSLHLPARRKLQLTPNGEKETIVDTRRKLQLTPTHPKCSISNDFHGLDTYIDTYIRERYNASHKEICLSADYIIEKLIQQNITLSFFDQSKIRSYNEIERYILYEIWNEVKKSDFLKGLPFGRLLSLTGKIINGDYRNKFISK